VLNAEAEREEKLSEEERDRLLSASHTGDNNEDAAMKHTSHSHFTTDVTSSIKDVHIDEGHQSKATGLFRRSLSSNKSHRRVVSRDSDSDDDSIGPSIPTTNSEHLPQPSNDESDDEIGPAAPLAVTSQNIKEGTRQQHESSDEEIGPPLPDAATSNSEHDDDNGSKQDTAAADDDDDDDDDGNDEVAVFTFVIFKDFEMLIFVPVQMAVHISE